ncbi:MAG: YlbF family regulator [Clostridia bacterium]|nr:YlbF family regulator [Clostridia bacterium]
MNVYDKANELARALSQSTEYRKLKDLKEKIDKDKTTKKMLDDFLKSQFEVQLEIQSGKQPDKQKTEKLQKLQEVVTYNRDISEFLQAQYVFGKMLSDIYKIIGDAVDIDFDFLKQDE